MFWKKVAPKVATSIETVSSFTTVDKLWVVNALRFTISRSITDPARVAAVAFPYKDTSMYAAAKRSTFAKAVSEFGSEQVLNRLTESLAK